MKATTRATEFKKLLANLAEKPDGNAIYELLKKLNQVLLPSISTIIDSVPLLQQEKLAPEKRKECANTIYEAAIEALTILKDTSEMSQDKLDTAKLNQTQLTPEQIEMLKALVGVNTLVITEDPTEKNIFKTYLEELGLKCSISSVEDALQILYNAQQGTEPFQIAMINVKHYNHHVAYLGRTIKANIHLGHVMTCLALPNELLTFEREQAHFDGFTCILNLSKTQNVATKLATSWRGWMAKITFAYGQPVPAKNHILLVEDDPIPQKITQWQLSQLGYTVDTAPDGHTALKLLSQNVYDLIFMDIGLPDISGLEVTAEIRKRETGIRHTPIIGLTIYAQESDEKTGLKAGMDEYLVKPVTPERLKEVVEHWVKENKASEAA